MSGSEEYIYLLHLQPLFGRTKRALAMESPFTPKRQKKSQFPEDIDEIFEVK